MLRWSSQIAVMDAATAAAEEMTRLETGCGAAVRDKTGAATAGSNGKIVVAMHFSVSSEVEIPG